MKKAVGEVVVEVRGWGTDNKAIPSTDVSFDCSWNTRRWLTKKGVVAAVAQGKVRLRIFCTK